MRRNWLALIPIVTVSCVSVGPKTIPRDRVEYAQALRDSWKRQLLQNMVALRYGEAPMFLEVASVINQYALEGQASAGVGWSTAVNGHNTGSLGVAGRYSDRPTITYAPVTGEKYVRTLLTPIPPLSIVEMVQAGWPVDFVLRLAVRTLNGLNSVTGTRLTGAAPNPDFFRVLQALRRIQQSGVIGMRVERRDKQDVGILLLEAKGVEAPTDDIRFLRDKLGLAAGTREFHITFGAVPSDDREIAMLTRSMMEVMIELASWIEVPPEHVADGRATPRQEPLVMEDITVDPLIRVRFATDEPAGAFAAVTLRDRWFFIDDRDLASKRVFSFLMILLSLAEGGSGQGAPVVTVQAGGG